MFTGIIKELGHLRQLIPNSTGARLEIASSEILQDVSIGDSIAANGCCLTVVELGPNFWSADVMTETMQRTCLGDLQPGDAINLERPVAVNGRLDGHLVQGHVDGIGVITKKNILSDDSIVVTVQTPPSLLRYIIEKGSIAVDGVSLTVTDIDQEAFSFAMIPHTAKSTTLGTKQEGAQVNLEVDVIAKYIEKLYTHRE